MVRDDRAAQRVMPLAEASTLSASVAVAEAQKVPGFTTGSIKPIITPPYGDNMGLEEATRGGLSDRVKLQAEMPTSNVDSGGGVGATPPMNNKTLLCLAVVAAILWFLLH